MIQEFYGDEYLSRSTIYEWFKRFKKNREDLNDDERLGRVISAVNEENVELGLADAGYSSSKTLLRAQDPCIKDCRCDYKGNH